MYMFIQLILQFMSCTGYFYQYPVSDGKNNKEYCITISELILFFPFWIMAIIYLILFNFLYFLRMDLLLNSQVLREKIKEGKLKERKVQCRIFWQKEIVLLAIQPFYNFTQYSLWFSNTDRPFIIFFLHFCCLAQCMEKFDFLYITYSCICRRNT